MIKLDLGLMADKAHVDAGGKLYILGEFRYIFAAKLPARHGQMGIVARWVAPWVEVRDKENMLQIEIVDQDANVIVPKSPKIPVTFAPIGAAAPGTAQAQAIFEMNGFVLTKYGPHVIHFYINENHAGEVTFHVTSTPVVPKPAAPPKSPDGQ